MGKTVEELLDGRNFEEVDLSAEDKGFLRKLQVAAQVEKNHEIALPIALKLKDHYSAGLIYEAQGDEDTALEKFVTAGARRNRPEATERAVSIYLRWGEPREAKSLFLSQQPTNLDLLALLVNERVEFDGKDVDELTEQHRKVGTHPTTIFQAGLYADFVPFCLQVAVPLGLPLQYVIDNLRGDVDRELIESAYAPYVVRGWYEQLVDKKAADDRLQAASLAEELGLDERARTLYDEELSERQGSPIALADYFMRRGDRCGVQTAICPLLKDLVKYDLPEVAKDLREHYRLTGPFDRTLPLFPEED